MKNRIKVKVKDLIEGILKDEIKYKTVEYDDKTYEYNEDEREYTHNHDENYMDWYDYLFDDIYDDEDNLIDTYNADVIAIENKKIKKLKSTELTNPELLEKVNEIIDELNEGE